MATSPESDVAAKLIERLLTDPAFRTRFRRDPAGACREAGLDELAQEMSLGAGKAMHTLDIRESKSSLAGVMMAAAMEGFGIYQLTENVLPHLEDVPGNVADVLSRVDLPALPKLGLGGALNSPPAASAAAAPATADPLGGTADAAGSADVGAAGAPPPAANALPEAPADKAAAADAAKASTAPPEAVEKPKPDPAQAAAEKIKQENSPEAAQQAAQKEAAAALEERGTGLPEASDLPTAGAAAATSPPESVAPAPPAAPEATPSASTPALPETPPAAGDTTLPSAPASDTTLPTEAAPEMESTEAAPGTAGTTPGTAGGVPVEAAPAPRRAIDPAQFGGEGTGGPPDPEALALLKNDNVVLDATGIADIKAGRIDPRVVGVLTKLSQEHKITVSCMCSDHPKLTSGGSVSNHHFGRGMDIAAIDGEIVGPGSPLAREVASELSSLDPSIRPNEIGSPFAINGDGYFTDAAHQNHLHIGFKQAITPDWTPPAGVAAGDGAAVAPAAGVAAVPGVAATTPAPAGAAAAAAAPKVGRGSHAFLKAVTATAAEADRKRSAGNDSLAFLKAVEPPKASAATAPVSPGGLVDAALTAPAGSVPYPGDSATKVQYAAWMASEAEKRGLPPELPIMASLVESGMRNLDHGDADSIGFFQMRVSLHDRGEYAGFGKDPQKQIKWFLDEAETAKNARVAAGKPLDESGYGEWVADTERPAAQYRYKYGERLQEARGLLAQARTAAPVTPPAVDPTALVQGGGGGAGGSSLGSTALEKARSQLGVKEVGTNRGPQVDQYLAAAKVDPGNPWCASFVTWALEQSGHKMDGGGWAAVQTWVRNAEAGNNNLQIVSAADARPGDIVAYDWGGQTDFGSDGHIGFLDSQVGSDGKFTALEGNNNDQVMNVGRSTAAGANVVFIRINGDAPAGGAPPLQPGAPPVTPGAPPVEPAGARKPIDPAQFGGEGTGTGGPPDAEALALLKNDNVVLDATGIADIKAGRIDPRVVGVLTKLSQEHKITVSCMCSDHSKFTAGGSVSNHFFGRGMDIAAIDGEIVGPGSPLAREVASELSSLDPSIRPNEIGSPFAINGDGYFTDAAHQNHLHIGFKEAIDPSWKPPADVAATTPAAAPGAPVAVAAAVPGAAPAAAPAPEVRKGSHAFLKAVTASAAEAHRKQSAGNDSMAFLKAVEPPKAGIAAVDPAAAQPGAPAGAVADAAAVAAAAPDAYPGDNAPREQIAAWMAGQAQQRGLPPQLPLMASLVESDMQNVNHGDADSVGFFQMRVGIWNQGAYAGYPDDPKLQVKWFLDQAEAVKRQRIVAGKPIDDPNSFGEWIADVERPAEQYRGRYQTRLDEANRLLASAPQQPAAATPGAAIDPAAATTPPAVVDPAAAAASAAAAGNAQLPAEILGPVQAAIAAGHAPGPKALKAIEEASKYIGTDYKWGGSTPQTGFDCSGLMQWSYAQSGVQIPRVTYTQIEAANGTEVASRSDLRPGDLVFFSNAGDVHHVGMYLGDQKFLHAPSTGDVVKVSSLDEPYFAGQFAGGRRFDGGAPVAGASASAAAVAPPATPAAAIDPTAVAKAQAAVARDAAEVRRNDSQLFRAITAEESTKQREKSRSMMFLKAIDPSQVKRPAAAAAAVPPVAPPVTPVAPPPEVTPAAVSPAPAPAQPPEAVAAASIDLTDAATEYPGNDASQAELAKWLAKQAEKAGLPPELPVMASLVESNVSNIDHGHADSVGFFQMRVSIWNQGAYAGYADKPELQAKWFIDQALAVKRAAIAKGDADFGKDPAAFGEWIADVERPAAEFRGRYQQRLGEARKLLSS